MDDRGQASIEWLGVVALIALVLVATIVAAGSGTSSAQAVVRQFHRALCIVSGGVCDLDRRPCVVGSTAVIDAVHVNFGVFRIGRDELILTERRSDGSVLVTYIGDTSAGLDVGVGADWWIRARWLDTGGGESARAALLASLGGGESWLFADGRAADRGMAALNEGHTPVGAQRVETIERDGVAVALDARRGGRTTPAGGRLDVDASIVEGGLFDERSGHTTLVVALDASAAAAGSFRVATRKAEASGRASGDLRIAVTSDATGRALELSLVRTGHLEGAASLPKAAQSVAEGLVGRTSGARRWIVEQRLDLTVAANLAAARPLVEALGRPLPVTAAATAGRRLEDVLEASGVTEVRTYDVDVEDGGGAGGHIAVGAKLGGAIEDRSESATLVDARVRGADGVWRTRSECLARGRG